MTRSLQTSKSEALNIALHAQPADCLQWLKNHVRNLKEEICAIQGIVDSEDLQLCVDALTGKRILILREDAQKKFEALFYYVQSLRAINEIELVLEGMEKDIPRLSNMSK